MTPNLLHFGLTLLFQIFQRLSKDLHNPSRSKTQIRNAIEPKEKGPLRVKPILEKKLSIRVPRYNIYIYICDRWFMLNNLGVLATRETIDPRIPTVSSHIQWAPAAKKLLSKPGCGWVTRENRRHNQPPLTNKEPTILNKDWDDWICLGCNTDTKIWKLQRKYYIRKLCIEILGSNPNYITFESLVKPPLLIAGLPAAGWH